MDVLSVGLYYPCNLHHHFQSQSYYPYLSRTFGLLYPSRTNSGSIRLYYPNARMRERHATNMYVSDNMIIGTRGFQYDLDLTDLATLGQAEPLQYPFKGETNLH
jgi:hypothetical protein